MEAAKSNAKAITGQDIDILFRLAELYNTEYDFHATEWFWGNFHEKNIEEYTSKYAIGSREYQFFERFTSKFELAGILVEKGFLDPDLFFDRYGSLQIEWEKCKPIIYGLREKWNEPRHRENFELLANLGREWQKNHPPKV
jgi:hypothetical protein